MTTQKTKKELDYHKLYNLTVPIMGKIKRLSDNPDCGILCEAGKKADYFIEFCNDAILSADIIPNTSSSDNIISFESLFSITIRALEQISELTKDAAFDPAMEIHEVSTDAKRAFDAFTGMRSDNSNNNAYLGLAMQLLPLTQDGVAAEPVIIESRES